MGIISLKYANITITNAEILNLRATPKQLVAAQGAGKIIQFINMAVFFDYTAIYTGLGNGFGVKYGDGSGADANSSNTLNPVGLLDQTVDMVNFVNLQSGQSNQWTKTEIDNKALVLHNTHSSEWTGGNAANVLRVRIAYRVLSAGW